MTLTVEGPAHRSYNGGLSTLDSPRCASARSFLSGGWAHATSVDRHALFDLDGELQSRLDLSKLSNEKVKNLMSLDVLLLAC